MDNISNNVYDYYLANLDKLSTYKRFHFASRLYLWSRDTKAKGILDSLEPWFSQHVDSPVLASAVQQNAGNASYTNMASPRTRYYQKYPELIQHNAALFHKLCLRNIYKLPAQHSSPEYANIDAYHQLFEQLSSDHDAIGMLSTHAVNFMYFYSHLVLKSLRALKIDSFLDIGQNVYNRSEIQHLRLLMYLYTHCIIGDSQFYFQSVDPSHVSVYRRMLDDISGLLRAQFAAISLDNKFEFLVCCRMLGYQQPDIEKRIMDEAAKSLSDKGTYLVDRHNSHPHIAPVDIESSEHRNVLFIMASRRFSPITQAP